MIAWLCLIALVGVVLGTAFRVFALAPAAVLVAGVGAALTSGTSGGLLEAVAWIGGGLVVLQVSYLGGLALTQMTPIVLREPHGETQPATDGGARDVPAAH